MKTTHIYRALLMAFLALGFGAQARAELANEQLQYVIKYKWGFIQKDAAWAKLQLVNQGDGYWVQLSGETMSWINDFLCVRDTLTGLLDYQYCMPREYIKSTHQGSEYNHDVVRYERRGDETIGRATRLKQKEGQAPQLSDTVLYARGPTYDLLSIFYYLRTVGFNRMKPGEEFTVNVFSGYTAQHLTIQYVGEENVIAQGREWPTYALRFTFTMDGRTMSDPMYVWLTTDDRQIPVKLEGVLSFGSVQAYYVGN